MVLSLAARALRTAGLSNCNNSNVFLAPLNKAHVATSTSQRRSGFVPAALSHQEHPMHYAAAEQAQATSGSIIKPRWRDVLQIAGVGIAATALFFQVGVLYPWHETLSEQMSELQSTVQAQAKEIADLKAAQHK